MEKEELNRLTEKDQISRLRSGNVTAILTTIKEIRSSGKVSILPVLFDLLRDEPEESVYNELQRFLNDLKNKEAVAYLVEAIRNPDYLTIRKELVASCWQNNLGYSEHAELFFDIVLEADYETAIEAFTVIEDLLGSLTEGERKLFSGKVRKQLPRVNEIKRPLVNELIRMVDAY